MDQDHRFMKMLVRAMLAGLCMWGVVGVLIAWLVWALS